MRYIILLGLFLLMISCDSFNKAELSKCLNDTASLESNSYKMHEEDVDRVFLDERTEHYIKFYYRAHFVCSGYDYGYEIEADSSDETVLELYITKKQTGPVPICACYKEMTVKYKNNSVDLTKITTIKVVQDGYDDKFFEFDEDGDDEPQEDADVISDEDAYVPDCAGLSAEECTAASGCEKITGSPANAEKQCWDKSITVGCNKIGTCNEMISFGYSPDDGKCYMFNDSCLPAGWDYAEEGDTQCDYSLYDGASCD